MRQNNFSNLFGILIGVNLIQLFVSIATVTVQTSFVWKLISVLLLFVYLSIWILLIRCSLAEKRWAFLSVSAVYWLLLATIVFLTQSGHISLTFGTIQIYLFGLPFSPLYFTGGYTVLYLLCFGIFSWIVLSLIGLIKNKIIIKSCA
ncbi:MAG: hypothetical protein ACRC1D_00850 [Culicoidibacterales bacterium]